MKRLIFVAVIIAVFSTGIFSYAQGLSVDEIVKRANIAAYYQGKDGMADVNMVITDSLGRKRIRKFTILRMNIQEGKDQKFYVYFYKPEDVRDMVYMVWKHVGADDDRWLYLPALDLVRRIAASDKRSSFVGSHFVYEDVSGRGIEEDTHELAGEENGCYKIKNTPKSKKFIDFAYYYVWVRKDNFLPIKGEYYNDQGEKYRVIEAEEIKDIQGHPTIVRMKASDLKSGGNTVISYDKVEYDIGLDEKIFTERRLRRPPSKWIKRK